MGYNTGMLKYILLAPLYRPVNFFKYGGGFVAIWNAVLVFGSSDTLTLDVFLDAYISYLTTKYLPPSTTHDIAIPIAVGAIAAGLKWRASMAKW